MHHDAVEYDASYAYYEYSLGATGFAHRHTVHPRSSTANPPVQTRSQSARDGHSTIDHQIDKHHMR